MVETIVFFLMVILAFGAGIWVWRMEVTGNPVNPPKTTDSPDNKSTTDKEESA